MPVDEGLQAKLNVRRQVKALADGDPEARDLLVQSIRDDQTMRAFVEREFARIGDAAVEPLAAILEDADKIVRRFAVQTLARIGDAAVEPLVATLNDEDLEVRLSAVRALGQLSDERAVQALITALGQGDARVVSRAATALSERGDPRAVEPLVAALEGRQDEVVSWFGEGKPWWWPTPPEPSGGSLVGPLEVLLERGAAATPTDILRRAARLTDSTTEYVWDDWMATGGGREEIKEIERHTMRVDCSTVRTLAEEELGRRDRTG